MKHKMGFLKTVSLCLGLVVLSVALCRAQAQSSTLKYEVDPTWPKPLPENWVTGQVSGVCVDGQDHVFIVNRNDMTDKEAEVSQQAPPFIEFDADGKVVNSFGDWKYSSEHHPRLHHRLRKQFLDRRQRRRNHSEIQSPRGPDDADREARRCR